MERTSKLNVPAFDPPRPEQRVPDVLRSRPLSKWQRRLAIGTVIVGVPITVLMFLIGVVVYLGDGYVYHFGGDEEGQPDPDSLVQLLRVFGPAGIGAAFVVAACVMLTRAADGRSASVSGHPGGHSR